MIMTGSSWLPVVMAAGCWGVPWLPTRCGLEAAPKCHQAEAGDVYKLGKARLMDVDWKKGGTRWNVPFGLLMDLTDLMDLMDLMLLSFNDD